MPAFIQFYDWLEQIIPLIDQQSELKLTSMIINRTAGTEILPAKPVSTYFHATCIGCNSHWLSSTDSAPFLSSPFSSNGFLLSTTGPDAEPTPDPSSITLPLPQNFMLSSPRNDPCQISRTACSSATVSRRERSPARFPALPDTLSPPLHYDHPSSRFKRLHPSRSCRGCAHHTTPVAGRSSHSLGCLTTTITTTMSCTFRCGRYRQEQSREGSRQGRKNWTWARQLVEPNWKVVMVFGCCLLPR